VSFAEIATAHQDNHSKCSHARNDTKGIPSLMPTALQQRYDLKYYCFNLSVSDTTTALSGFVTMKAASVVPILDSISFYLHSDYIIDSVKLNDIAVPFITTGHERIIPNVHLEQSTLFDVQIFYHGKHTNASAEDWTNGIYSNFVLGNHITWTISVPFTAYGWYPAKHQLNDKIDSADLHFTTSLSNKVASNGLLTSVDTLSDNMIRYNWKTNYPIDYYLIAFGVSNYREHHFNVALNDADSLPVMNYIYNDDDFFNQAVSDLNVVGDMLRFYSDTFCLYPFINEKYGHMSAPISGGMEHQTMITMMDYDEDLIAHEMSHQWFGDMVTCASFEHVWLNEGFATYCANYLMREYRHGFNDAQAHLRALRGSLVNYKSGSVRVPADNTSFERIYNGTLTYNKGALVLHNLRFVVNDDAKFFLAIRKYLNRFAYSTATTADFQSVMEEEANIDLDAFFNQWFYGEGYPVFKIAYWQEGNNLNLSSHQSGTSPSTPFFKTPFEIEIKYKDNSKERIRLYHQDSVQQFSVPISANKEIDKLIFDPDMRLLSSGSCYYEVRLRDVDNGTLKANLYPNPAKHQLNISCSEIMQTAEICNISGQKTAVIPIHNTQTTIDVANLAKGQYIITIHTDKGSILKRFSLQ
jgi:aminopeptidase N